MGSSLKTQTNKQQIFIEIKFHWMSAHVGLQNGRDKREQLPGETWSPTAALN